MIKSLLLSSSRGREALSRGDPEKAGLPRQAKCALLAMTGLLAFSLCSNVYANIIPLGNQNNTLYYKIGGGSDFTLPPVSSTDTINLNTNANLGLGYSCGAFNPALSITQYMNDLKDSVDNLANDLITNAEGALLEMPMYELAKANPTLYALFNNQLLSAHDKIQVSMKSCQVVKNQIAQGQNPYQDWATIAVGDQWKKSLSLVANGSADINQVSDTINATSGDDGLSWVQGNQNADGSLHAGGLNQPPVHVIADAVKAGYNAILNRDLQSTDPAPTNTSNSELTKYFANPQSATTWATAVLGDEVITTCNEDSCQAAQSSSVGLGLLPWVTNCNQDSTNCADTIKNNLANLVTGNAAITKDNLDNVSSDGVAISPDVISSIKKMDVTQQSIIIQKLSQEVSMQRVIDKALIIRNILSTGSQVPVIARNRAAQNSIHRGINQLDDDIKSLAFESDIRKKMMSSTLSEVMGYGNETQQAAMSVPAVKNNQPILQNSAMNINLTK